MVKKKNHPPYYLVFPALKLAGISHEEVAERLEISVRSFRDRVNGKGDFTFAEGHTIITMIIDKRPELGPVTSCLFLA